jgi:hypothetical protein
VRWVIVLAQVDSLTQDTSVFLQNSSENKVVYLIRTQYAYGCYSFSTSTPVHNWIPSRCESRQSNTSRWRTPASWPWTTEERRRRASATWSQVLCWICRETVDACVWAHCSCLCWVRRSSGLNVADVACGICPTWNNRCALWLSHQNWHLHLYL